MSDHGHVCPECRVLLLSLLSANATGRYALYLCMQHGVWRVYENGRIEKQTVIPEDQR